MASPGDIKITVSVDPEGVARVRQAVKDYCESLTRALDSIPIEDSKTLDLRCFAHLPMTDQLDIASSANCRAYVMSESQRQEYQYRLLPGHAMHTLYGKPIEIR